MFSQFIDFFLTPPKVRPEDMAYLVAQGLLEGLAVSGKEALADLRVEESQVAGLQAALLAALADTWEVEAVQDKVDIKVRT